MAITNTDNKGLKVIGIGDSSWGPPLNDNADILDKALGSFTTITGTSGSVTLTETQYQNMCLKSGTAALLANFTFTIPSGVAGQWVVNNQSAANSFELRVKNAGDAAFVSIENGETRIVYSDGDKVFFADTRQTIPVVVEVPAGMVMYYANAPTPPTGWLTANGASVSRTAYAELFAAIGTRFGSVSASTFNLPELRGEFLRSWHDGRAVDNPRAFGSAQTDAFQGHFHEMRLSSGQEIDFETVNGNSGANRRAASAGGVINVREAVTNGTNGTPRTASETRPRNVALLACIKY